MNRPRFPKSKSALYNATGEVIDVSKVLTNFMHINEKLPRNEGFSDIDAIYEKSRHFLVLEWIEEEESISKGQLWLLRSLASLPRFTVYVVKGEKESGEVFGYHRVVPNGLQEFKECTTEDFAYTAAGWREDLLRRVGK